MGTYRTKPEEVEAIQYTGSTTSPFNERTPHWVWGAFSHGILKFAAHGMTIDYNGLSEHVSPNDWLVMSADGIIRACEDKVFQQYYTPYRIRRTKAEIEAEKAAEVAAATGQPAEPDDLDRALNAAFPEGNIGEAA